MEENKNQQPQGLQIELKPEIGVGVYANLALITHSSSDFILDFTCMLPGMQQPQVRSRVVMAPEHAKRLLMALNDNIQKYEQNFGKHYYRAFLGRRFVCFVAVNSGINLLGRTRIIHGLVIEKAYY